MTRLPRTIVAKPRGKQQHTSRLRRKTTGWARPSPPKAPMMVTTQTKMECHQFGLDELCPDTKLELEKIHLPTLVTVAASGYSTIPHPSLDV